MRALRHVFGGLLLAALSIGGCYQVRIVSGAPMGPAAPGHQDRWHHGVVNGIVELEGNYQLDQLCPQGWAAVESRTDLFTGLVQNFVGLVYAPQLISVECAAAGAEAPAAPATPTAAR